MTIEEKIKKYKQELKNKPKTVKAPTVNTELVGYSIADITHERLDEGGNKCHIAKIGAMPRRTLCGRKFSHLTEGVDEEVSDEPMVTLTDINMGDMSGNLCKNCIKIARKLLER